MPEFLVISEFVQTVSQRNRQADRLKAHDSKMERFHQRNRT